MQTALTLQAEPDFPGLQHVLVVSLDDWRPGWSQTGQFHRQHRRFPAKAWQILCKPRGPERPDVSTWRISVSDEQNTFHKEAQLQPSLEITLIAAGTGEQIFLWRYQPPHCN